MSQGSNAWSALQGLLLGSVRDRERGEMETLYRRVANARAEAPLVSKDQIGAFLTDLIADICYHKNVVPSDLLADALWWSLRGLLVCDGFIVELPEPVSLSTLSMEESVELRAALCRHLRFLGDQERLLSLWREKMASLFSALLDYLPLSAFTDLDERAHAMDDAVVLPEAKAYDLCESLPEALDRTITTFFEDDVFNADLFHAMRDRLEQNAWTATGVLPGRRPTTAQSVTLPSEHKNTSPEFLVSTYLSGTPLQEFFESPLPFAIPFPARFEHTHIVGGTGHGKTQLMQFLINHDLVRAQGDTRAVVVLDSQGDLIRTIANLSYFGSSAQQSLAERFVLIDPNDVEHPACLNMFDFNRERLSGFAAVDREKILNATIELYEYFFGALLGAELTQRQGLIFKYLARLMMEIPEATIHTLRELMEDSERFRPYMQRLSGTARSFFETRFFDRQFNETKKQILTRLWGVLSNTTLERMFSHPRSAIDLFALLNEGKIILINTAKELLGQEGSAIFGRFFIALIAQAAVQRAAIPAHERNPGFVYIDEAQDYFDDSISHLLNQARKYRLGLTLAHQNLDQLTPALRASVSASTSIKFAGGVSAKDATALDSEFRCTSDFLLAQRKHKKLTEFACYVKNYTRRGLSVSVPLGFVEKLPTLNRSEYETLLEGNRLRYCALATPYYQQTVETARALEREELDVVAAVPAPQPAVAKPELPAMAPPAPSRPRVTKALRAPADSGRGGRQHKYLQHFIKGLAEERGFRASIEESILDGGGRVDVALLCGDRRIAFEISVTTNRDHELGNIEKCLAAGFAEVVVVGSTERHLSTLRKFIEASLEQKIQAKVRYLVPDTVMTYLDSLQQPALTEQIVRGYKVRTSQSAPDPVDADTRRQAIAAVIARSMRRS